MEKILTIKKYHGLTIDYSRDDNLNTVGKSLVVGYYLKKNEKSPQEAYARTAINFCAGDMKLAQRLYDYVSQGWMSFASPLLSNSVMGTWENGVYMHSDKIRGMPISCFIQFVPDTLQGQIEAAKELANLSCAGGGVGSYLGMRGITSKSPGAIPYAKTQDSNIMYYHQAGTRRGSVASYLDISHPDIQEFIGIRNPTGGDINRKAHNVNIGVNLTYAFMDACINDESWDLIAPDTGEVVETIPSARELWQEILETRFRTGEPYLHNVDESNDKMNAALKAMGLEVKSSNICLVGNTEITISETIDGANPVVIELDKFNEMFNMGYYTEIYVKSFNTETHKEEFSLVVASAETAIVDELMVIEFDGKVIECTPEHLVLTKNRGYVAAGELVSTDVLVS